MVEYNFDMLSVNVDFLERLIDSLNVELLWSAFDWYKTPQGTTYWGDQATGRTKLQVDVLKDMLEQYDAWEKD